MKQVKFLLSAVIVAALMFSQQSFAAKIQEKTEKKEVKKGEKKDVKKSEKVAKESKKVEPKKGKNEPKKESAKTESKKIEPKKEVKETKAAAKNDDAVDPKLHGPNNEAVHTGPRGGKYYINKNGNKTYITPDSK